MSTPQQPTPEQIAQGAARAGGQASTTSNKKKTDGTLSPEALAAAAEFIASGASGATTTSSSIISGVSRGIDPTTGKPITSAIYKPGYEQSYIKNLSPKDRIALQKQMKALGLYPSGYTPAADGMVTQADFDAVAKLVTVGEQKGIGDINNVISLAKRDKTVASFLKTGGYAQTGGITPTDTATAASTLTNYYLDLFNDKPTKEEIKAYQTALNTRERSAKGGMTSDERNDIILSIANKRILSAADKALGGDAKAADLLDSGQLGRRVRELKAAYADNGIPVNEKTIYKLAGQSLRSDAAYENVLEDITLGAKTQWGKLADTLKPGQTMRSKLQPYISVRAQIRGISEDQIKVSEMTDVLNSDGTFKNFSQYEDIQYKSKEYLNSDAFKTVKRNDAQVMLRDLGVM